MFEAAARPASRRSFTPPRSACTRPARRIARSTSRGRARASTRCSTRATRRRPSARSTPSKRANPRLRVVRLRPGLIFKREAGPEIRRLFAGPFLPAWLTRAGTLPGAAAARPARPCSACTATTSATPTGSPRCPSRRLRRLQHRRRPGARSGHARSRAQDESRVRVPERPLRIARRLDLARAPATRAARLGRHGPRRSGDGHHAREGAARLDPHHRRARTRCARSSPACASPRAWTPRRSGATPAGACAAASSSPASAAAYIKRDCPSLGFARALGRPGHGYDYATSARRRHRRVERHRTTSSPSSSPPTAST